MALKKKTGYLTSTVKGRDWGAEHVNDVRRLIGGEIFNGPVFGSKAAMVSDEQRNESVKKLMQQVFQYADQIGMKIIYAMDIDTHSANPQDIILSLPKEARLKTKGTFHLVNPDTDEGYAYYKKRISDLLETYPQIDQIAFWKRRVKYQTPWKDLKYEYFPESWRKEYDEIIANHIEIRDDEFSEPTFPLSKLITTYIKAIEELGYKVEYSCGSWDFPFLKTANVFLPKDIALMPLDYKIAFGDKEISSMLKSIGRERKLYPIVWAHHDDHRYIGKPYTPWKNFSELLKDSNSDGFGIIHWKTRPLDLYFTSLSRQTWSSTENEDLSKTVDYFVQKTFGEGHETLNKYMNSWIREAPMFGRETSDSFFDYGEFIIGEERREPSEFLVDVQKRKQLLEAVNLSKLNKNGLETLQFYKGMEDFFESTIKNQQLVKEAQIAVQNGYLDKAREVILKVDLEESLKKYIDYTSFGERSRGEEAMIISLNLRWIPDVWVLRQLTGLSPIRYNFQPTSHDSLAQWPGHYTYFIDKKNNHWYGLGQKELNVKDVVSDKKILDDITDSYLVLKKSLCLSLKIREFNLSQGDYKLVIHVSNSQDAKIRCAINSKENKLFDDMYNINNGTVNLEFTITDNNNELCIETYKELKVYGIEIIPLL
tara:strand:- start:6043 stop:7998 length:1956 start_codon:yes stop_codon:yes gene_type:complete